MLHRHIHVIIHVNIAWTERNVLIIQAPYATTCGLPIKFVQLGRYCNNKQNLPEDGWLNRGDGFTDVRRKLT